MPGHDRPGDVRERENWIEREVILGSTGDPLRRCHRFSRANEG